jgi:hypothetical protein
MPDHHPYNSTKMEDNQLLVFERKVLRKKCCPRCHQRRELHRLRFAVHIDNHIARDTDQFPPQFQFQIASEKEKNDKNGVIIIMIVNRVQNSENRKYGCFPLFLFIYNFFSLSPSAVALLVGYCFHNFIVIIAAKFRRRFDRLRTTISIAAHVTYVFSIFLLYSMHGKKRGEKKTYGGKNPEKQARIRNTIAS